MQAHIDDIRRAGGEVLAVSVDPPERSREIAAAYGISYRLLSDPALAAIDAYGVRHAGGGMDGDIARPATFILDREGRVVWRDLTENWRVRARPGTIVEQLRRLP